MDLLWSLQINIPSVIPRTFSRVFRLVPHACHWILLLTDMLRNIDFEQTLWWFFSSNFLYNLSSLHVILEAWHFRTLSIWISSPSVDRAPKVMVFGRDSCVFESPHLRLTSPLGNPRVAPCPLDWNGLCCYFVNTGKKTDKKNFSDLMNDNDQVAKWHLRTWPVFKTITCQHKWLTKFNCDQQLAHRFFTFRSMLNDFLTSSDRFPFYE